MTVSGLCTIPCVRLHALLFVDPPEGSTEITLVEPDRDGVAKRLKVYYRRAVGTDHGPEGLTLLWDLHRGLPNREAIHWGEMEPLTYRGISGAIEARAHPARAKARPVIFSGGAGASLRLAPGMDLEAAQGAVLAHLQRDGERVEVIETSELPDHDMYDWAQHDGALVFGLRLRHDEPSLVTYDPETGVATVHAWGFDDYYPSTTDELCDMVSDAIDQWFDRAAKVQYRFQWVGDHASWQASQDGTTWVDVSRD